MSGISDITHADVERILGIIDKLHDIEVRIEVDGMKLHVRKFSNGALATPAMRDDATPYVETTAAPPVAAAVEPAPSVPRKPAALSATGSEAAPSMADAGPVRESLLEVRAPMLGRFFRASSPTESPYVEIGSKVEPDDTVCMIEVMKLFNTVKAGVRGTIVEIAVENGEMVEYDTVLFRVRPE